jgi:hypothetical protein
MRENDLLERTFDFGVRCLKFLRTLPITSEYSIIKYQLGKSQPQLVRIMKNRRQDPQKSILKIK